MKKKSIWMIILASVMTVLALWTSVHGKPSQGLTSTYYLGHLHPGHNYALVSTLCTKTADKYVPIHVYGKELAVTKVFKASDTRQTTKVEYPVFFEDLETVLPPGPNKIYKRTILYENGEEIRDTIDKEDWIIFENRSDEQPERRTATS